MTLFELRSRAGVASFTCLVPLVIASISLAYAQPNAPDARDLFAAGEVLEIEIEMAESDWDTIRMEGRSLPHVLASCTDPNFDSYTRVRAMVSIDGESTSDVSVRKKGFIGSLSTSRPSLRLDYGRDENDGRTFHGVRRLALNNNNQDPSNAKQCVAYELFAEAGIAAPRCSLAQVSVNGVDRGFFTSLETVNKPFLRRVFADDDGNLYESQLGDFTPELRGGYELKTNNAENDTSDLDRVLRVVGLPDDEFVAAFSEVFDLDEFMTYWAMEVLTGHWDGMTGNLNNHFIYHDPTDDRFHPIPWGTDGTFMPHIFRPDNPQSVYVSNSLSSRLYAIPAMRRMYQDRLRELLDQVWDEDLIMARFRSIIEQTQGDAASLPAIDAFVRSRRSAILEELASNNGNGPDVSNDPSLVDGTCNEPETVSGLIDFTWNDMETAFQPVADLDAVQVQIPLENGSVQFVAGQVAHRSRARQVSARRGVCRIVGYP